MEFYQDTVYNLWYRGWDKETSYDWQKSLHTYTYQRQDMWGYTFHSVERCGGGMPAVISHIPRTMMKYYKFVPQNSSAGAAAQQV